jgi:hypothetical protein
MQTVAQSNQLYSVTCCPGTMRTGSDKYINKNESEKKCLPPMQVSLQPTQTCQQANESVNNNNIHKTVLQSEGFFLTMMNNIMSIHT